MFKDRVTIVTPSMNRHKYLKRMMDYYSDVKINIIVVDGSAVKFPCADDYPNLEYYHMPVPFMGRFLHGINEVKTAHVLISPDDVLYSFSAIDKCVEFLESNPDYSGVQGYQASLYNTNGECRCKIERSLPIDISSDSASDRMLKMVAYGNQFWRFWRTDACREVFGNFPHHKYQHLYVCILCELAINIGATIVGKYKSLPIYCSMHEDVRSVQGKERKGFSFYDFCTKPEWSELYTSYVNDLVDLLLAHESISRELAELYVKKTILFFAAKVIGVDEKKTVVKRVKNELRSVWRKTGGKREFARRKALQKLMAQEVNDSRLAQMESGCKSEMEHAIKFLTSYSPAKTG